MGSNISKIYIRDGRAPILKNESISKVMSANKARNTEPEMILRHILWAHGLRGYRLYWKKVPGRPDITFPYKKLAIFVNGCFWHRCPYCKLSLPKSNRKFWKNKFARNKNRDLIKIQKLKEQKWTVIIVWECQIKKKLPKIINKIVQIYKNV
ncbi:MAG: very short patch repair endonuclease [Candidatus Pacebacteria bacterium]|nr:very short patch repair endonuclease [Candidatus Paceibacterota bacterium]